MGAKLHFQGSNWCETDYAPDTLGLEPPLEEVKYETKIIGFYLSRLSHLSYLCLLYPAIVDGRCVCALNLLYA